MTSACDKKLKLTLDLSKSAVAKVALKAVVSNFHR